MKYFVELFMEFCASQMIPSLHKNAATEGSVGWLETPPIQLRRSDSPTKQRDMNPEGASVEPGQGREANGRGSLEHKGIVVQMIYVNGKQSKVMCDSEGESGLWRESAV